MMKDIYRRTEKHNLAKVQKSDDMTASVIRNKKQQPAVNKLFIRGPKFSVSSVLIKKS